VDLFLRVVCALTLLLVGRVPSVAQAQAEAKVWVNTRSGVYHCPGTRYYGTTKAGTFMAEAEARAAGHHPTHGESCSPMAPSATGAPDSVGASGTVAKARPLAATVTPATEPAYSVKVWVNMRSAVYHCNGTRYYGNTKSGRYMSESEARTAGNRPAYGRVCS
jgi:hypothetical protein